MSAWAWRGLALLAFLLMVALFVGMAAEARVGWSNRFPAVFVEYAKTTFGYVGLALAASGLLLFVLYALMRGEAGRDW